MGQLSLIHPAEMVVQVATEVGGNRYTVDPEATWICHVNSTAANQVMVGMPEMEATVVSVVWAEMEETLVIFILHCQMESLLPSTPKIYMRRRQKEETQEIQVMVIKE